MRTFRAATAFVTALACSAIALAPAKADVQPPTYVVSVNEAVAQVTQILAAGTTVDGYTWQGIPDGLGGLKNSDGTITVFVNHELSAADGFTAAIDRPYGGFGSDITAVTYDPSSNSVTHIESAIKSALWYDYSTGTYSDTPEAPEDAANADSAGAPNHTTAINRLASATLVNAGALAYSETRSEKYHVKVWQKTYKKGPHKGKKIWKWRTRFREVTDNYGVSTPVWMTNEAGSDESRVFGLDIATGQIVQLPALGLGTSENSNIAPASATGVETVSMSGENGSATDSQLFMYHGTKQTAGTWFEKAGLTNGSRFVADVLSSGVSVANDVAARSAMVAVNVSSAVRGFTSSISKVKVVEGQLTITTSAAHDLKVGDYVTVSGLGTVSGVDLSSINGEHMVESVGSTTTITFGADVDNIAETTTTGTLALPTDSVVITTAAASGVVEGDTVNLNNVNGLSGKYDVTGALNSTTFTVTAAGDAFSVGAGGSVNKVLDVAFRRIPTNIAGDAQQVVARLRGTEFSRIADAQFNPANPNEYFFVTTQSDSDGVGAAGVKEGSRDGGALWKLTFVDVAQPEQGAKLELVVNGTEAPLNDPSVKINMPNNVAITADGQYALLQEDPGAKDHLARVLAVRLSDKAMVSVAQFDANYFDPNHVNSFLTNSEATAGIVDATSLLAGSNDTASYFFFDAQVHPVSAAGGLNYGSDPLKWRAVGLMRPDLNPQTSVNVSAVEANGANGSRRVQLTLTGVSANTDNTGFIVDATGTTIDVNDVITLFGSDKSVNGSYEIASIDAANKTLKVKVADSIAAGAITTPAGGAPRIVITTSAGDKTLKTGIIEGGALYTLKIADWNALFTVS